MRDPHTRARAHHRLQRRDEAARRVLDDDLAGRSTLMDARLAIREHDHAIAFEVRPKRLAQPRGRPRTLRRKLHLRGIGELLFLIFVREQMDRNRTLGSRRQRS